MSRENVDRFLEATEAFNRFAADPARDGSSFLRFLDPEVRFEPQQAALQGTYEGLDGARAWLADLAEHYGDGHTEYVDVRDVGDRVLALGSLRVTGTGSGIEIDVPVAVVARFRDGLITHFKDYGDRDQALASVGETAS
jgi:ketosteroid isomerase-like protein